MRSKSGSISVAVPAYLAAEAEVLLDRQLGEDVAVLRHERDAHARDGLGRLAGDGLAVRAGSRPAVGLSVPAMVSSVVDLPAPFGPTMQTISPASTRTETPRTAGTRP